MSPLWRDRVLVWLAPTEVSWVRLAGGFNRRVRAKRVISVDAAYGTESWQGAVAALREEAPAWRNESLAVTVVLSNHFLRYAVIPASDGVSGMEEARALARFHFSKIHGDRARGWDVRLGDIRASRPQLASAADEALVPALHACFEDGRPRLASVRPYLMSAFNRWRHEIPAGGAWLLLLERERACLALIAKGNWVMVQNLKGSYPHPEAWSELRERERWRVDVDPVPETVFVHTAQPASTALPRDGMWKFLGDSGFWPAGLTLPEDWGYAAALTAI